MRHNGSKSATIHLVLLVLIGLVILVAGTKATSLPLGDILYDDNKNNKDRLENDFSKLVSWMESHGGRVDERVAVVLIPPSNKERKSIIDEHDNHNDADNSLKRDMIRGVVAVDDIAEGTELLFCPWELVIGSTSLEKQMQSSEMCVVVEKLRTEFELGSDSLWWPYLNHIEIPRLVAMWDTSAVMELQGLAPTHDASRHLDWMIQTCGKNPPHDSADEWTVSEWDKYTMQALVSFITRASAVGMVPIYDLLNHHNGKRNAKLVLTQDGVQLVVVGGGPIRRDDQIFLSYGVKSASTMMRDYGFVEDWPSIWSWTDTSSGNKNVFVLFPDGIVAIQPSTDFLQEIWHTNIENNNNSNGASSLVQMQNSAIRHTAQTLSRDALVRFSTSARNFLDGLATTLIEDVDILKEKKKYLLTQMNVGAAAFVQAQDIVQAITYRIVFKEAVLSAFTFAEATVAKIDEANLTQEL